MSKEVLVGGVYRNILKDKDNPFDKTFYRVKVFEVRQGYVRYRFEDINFSNTYGGTDNSLKADTFLGCYELDENEVKPESNTRRIVL